MEFRSIDGTGNSFGDPGANARGDALIRIAPARFTDGAGAMPGGPNPREISNIVVGEGEAAAPNAQGLSGMMYAWGQFIDHDLIRTRSDAVTHIDITVSADDPVFAPGSTIELTRLVVDPTSGTDAANPRAAVNNATGWLDGSVVYGADALTAAALRGAGGKLLTSAGDNLPIVGGSFLAGDPRAAENFSLTALQTLFVREHNWQVDRLAAGDPSLTADQLYETARAIVGAEIANITYSEFLPALLGDDALPDYAGYDPTVDPRIGTEFAGAAWRWGHSTVSAGTGRVTETGADDGEEQQLRDVFFAPPAAFLEGSGAAGFLRHLGTDLAQAMDARIVEDLRNFLLDPPAFQDLAAINIQRGRDLGLPTLNGMRESLGLSRHDSFADISDDPATVAALEQAFGDVDQVDLWTGGLSERLVDGAFLGETFSAVVIDQFSDLRAGDRLWWQNQGFAANEAAAIETTSLADLIRRHTDTRFLQDNVFLYAERRAADVEAESLDGAQIVVGTGDGQVLVGGRVGDLLAGRARAQTLDGGEGADTLAGGGGNDLLLGGTGDDTLRGGAGADTLVGGVGEDRLTGGDGADRFRLTVEAAVDRILDFVAGEDRIDLADLAVGEFLWLGTAGFSSKGLAEARFALRGGHVLLQADRDGDGIVDVAAAVFGVASLAAGDIVL